MALVTQNAEVNEARDLIEIALKRSGWTMQELAEKSGVSKATLHRAMNPDYEFVPSGRTLNKLATVIANLDIEHLMMDAAAADRRRAATLRLIDLPIRFEVAAGAWREVDANYDEPRLVIRVAPIPPFESYPQWGELVVGDSYNQRIPEGSYVHVVDAIAIRYAPRHGDTVVVARRRGGGSLEERTIKEVVITPSAVELWPRSYNPRWNQPLSLTDGSREGEDVVVEIAGLVLRSYQIFSQ